MKSAIILSALLALTSAHPGAIEFNSGLEGRQDQSTRNDLKNLPCRRVTVIFGRGSGQIGNVGTTVGIPFFNALSSRLGVANIAIQGVDYPATYPGAAAGGSRPGAATLVSLVQLAASKCPNTAVVLSGYSNCSQGAQLIHLAGPNLASVASNIKAVVVFGDPYNPQAITNIAASKVKQFCATGDVICHSTAPFDPNAHTSYGINANEAAAFVATALGGTGTCP